MSDATATASTGRGLQPRRPTSLLLLLAVACCLVNVVRGDRQTKTRHKERSHLQKSDAAAARLERLLEERPLNTERTTVPHHQRLRVSASRPTQIERSEEKETRPIKAGKPNALRGKPDRKSKGTGTEKSQASRPIKAGRPLRLEKPTPSKRKDWWEMKEEPSRPAKVKVGDKKKPKGLGSGPNKSQASRPIKGTSPLRQNKGERSEETDTRPIKAGKPNALKRKPDRKSKGTGTKKSQASRPIKAGRPARLEKPKPDKRKDWWETQEEPSRSAKVKVGDKKKPKGLGSETEKSQASRPIKGAFPLQQNKGERSEETDTSPIKAGRPNARKGKPNRKSKGSGTVKSQGRRPIKAGRPVRSKKPKPSEGKDWWETQEEPRRSSRPAKVGDKRTPTGFLL